MIVANAGILVARVIYAKDGRDKTFTIVDAAMNDLIRPTLYEAYHEVWPSTRPGPAGADRPGHRRPICETGDYLALDRRLPLLPAGDLVAFMTAGAYGAAMSSTYNSRLLVPEVLVKGEEFAVVRPRQTYAELIGPTDCPSGCSPREGLDDRRRAHLHADPARDGTSWSCSRSMRCR